MNNRNTKQRQLILEVVQMHHDHPDAETIYQDVHKINSHISVGTVYRNLNLLSKQGLIKHIKVPGTDRYDYQTHSHYHVLCTECGKLVDSPINYDNSVNQEVETKTGFKITKHRMFFEGICPECLKRHQN